MGMMFKKGSFEIDTTFYPVAIKYNPYFGNAFWNSSKFTMVHYLVQIFSAWCIVADVYYLPAQTRRSQESALAFANRVKQDIAERGGLLDLAWDGGLKRRSIKKREKEEEQSKLTRRSVIKRMQVCGDSGDETFIST